MSLLGYSITGDVYAWTAVLILPINSALNPFLYTLSSIIARKVGRLQLVTMIKHVFKILLWFLLS